MKTIIKLIFFISLSLIFTRATFALTKVYDLNIASEYTISDTGTLEISQGYGKLIPQLESTGSISNSDPGTNLNNVEDIFVDGNYLYAAGARSDAIDIIDVSNPANPTVAGSISNGGQIELDDPRAITKSGSYLYVASNRSDAIEIINVSNPNNPTHAASVNDGGTTYLNGTRGLTISGNYLYATAYIDDALEIIDISDPNNPSHVGSLRNTTRLNGAEGIAVDGNYAYITSYNNDSLQVIDISNPSSPSFVGEIAHNGSSILLDGAKDIVIEGNYAYVAGYISDSIQVIDISTPSNPTAVTNIVNGAGVDINGASDLYIFSNRLMVASRDGDYLSIFRIENPEEIILDNKVIIGTDPNLSGATSIMKLGAYTYIGSNIEDKIIILDSYVSSDSPYITPNEPLVYSGTIDQGTVELPVPENVTYQISKDNGNTWYYLSGTTWTPSTQGAIHSNSPGEMNPELQSFNNISGGTGEFKWKAFLNSNGNFITEIDSVTVYYTSESTNKILDFETAGGYTVSEGTWTRTTNNPEEGLYSIESGNNTDNSSSCFEFSENIYNDSTISFFIEVSSEANYDFLKFYIDGVEQDRWSGEISWEQELYDIGNGPHTFEWCYEKDYSVSNGSDTAWVDYIEIKEKPIIVENIILDFETSGGYTVTTTETNPGPDWERVTTEKFEGNYSIESQNSNDNTNSCFERVETVSSSDNGISFYRKVSSEDSYDFLIFSIDSIEQDRWSGEISWAKEVYNLSPGTYTLEWCYTKDGSISNGSDKAWVDYVVLEKDIPIISEVTPVDTPANDSTPDYTFYSPVTGNISYSGSCTSSTYTGAVIGNNTVTFDTLSDGIYTDCSIQVLGSTNSNILAVNNFTIDTTAIDITINNPLDQNTIPNSNFNIDLSYSDENGVNTGSIILELYKWDGISSYGPDISGTYVNFSGATITSTGAIYPSSALGEGQFKIKFSIEDTTGNVGISDSVFYVTGGDATPPIVTFNYPFSGALIPNSDFDLNISYSDPETGVNTGSINGTLTKWDGVSSYGPDISGTYVNFSGATITGTGAIYPISKLGFGRYQMNYYIANNNSVASTGSLDFFVDEPEFTINTGSLDIGKLKAGISKFSDDEFIVTVKTVGAPFNLILNKSSNLINGTVEIISWNGIEGFGYEVPPYSDTIYTIGTDTILASQSGSINTDGNRNMYQYLIQMGALINEEQAAGSYSGSLKFTLDLDY